SSSRVFYAVAEFVAHNGAAPLSVGGRLPRPGDVPHVGRSAALVPRVAGAARERILEVPLLPSESRGMGRLLAARPDPPVVLLSRRRGAAVFAGRAAGPRTIDFAHDAARLLARVSARRARHLPAIVGARADVFHVRRYAHADRPGLRVSLPDRPGGP